MPCGRITNEKNYSIITDHLGTPIEMHDTDGKKYGKAQLDIYGRVPTFTGHSLSDCPFRYQGQYQDVETGLYYNGFRYYDPDMGSYLSQDPIGIVSENVTIYSYVKDVNSQDQL